MEPTPSTNKNLPLRTADFSSLAEALDYAAEGETGCNFYDGRGQLYAAFPYRELKERARALARRLVGAGLEPGARVALVAETYPDFLRFFFACQYAGLLPVPLPISVQLGSHRPYVRQLRQLLLSCKADAAVAPDGFVPFLTEAAQGLGLRYAGSPDLFDRLPEGSATLRPLGPDDVAYLQYTSGSTRFPRGVVISQRAVLSNIAGILNHGLKVRPGDRCVSWLPYYHDMGLVGFVLGPVVSQLSIDYLSTRDFAMRPRQWLALMTRNRATISFSPPFGYELCARRVREGEASGFDLSAWRVAGVGAEMIRPEVLERFANALAPSGFNKKAFLACYGMAECSLAVSFAPLGQGLQVDRVDGDRLAEINVAARVDAESGGVRVSNFVNCGQPLPEHEVVIQDEAGRMLPDRECGSIYVRGPSVMSGYFGDPSATAQVLSGDGWLDTGDIGYRLDGQIVITGRRKDLIIINGRNIWPQDLEYLAEQQPLVRPGDASAFSVPGPGGEEVAVLVVQCRESDNDKRRKLVTGLQRVIGEEFGIDCHIELVPLHTLPRTSSGKLSRSRARDDFLKRSGWRQMGSRAAARRMQSAG